jgi:hypothetical protein
MKEVDHAGALALLAIMGVVLLVAGLAGNEFNMPRRVRITLVVIGAIHLAPPILSIWAVVLFG